MIKREKYLSRVRGFYHNDLVKVLVGIRRCGKSIILNQIIEELKNENNIKDYLLSVFDSIILRDVVDRFGLKDINLFSLILEYLIDTTGRKFSATNIINFLKSEGREVSTITIYNYLDALCKALIIKKIYRYDISGKAILKTLNKYYMTDLGIARN